MSFLVGVVLGALGMFLFGLPKIKAEIKAEVGALVTDLFSKIPRP